MTLKRLWAATRSRAGWPGAAALLAVLAAGVISLLLAPRWQADADAADAATLRAQRSERDTLLRSAARVDTHVARAPVLPAAQATPNRMADLHSQALLHGVVVDRMQLRDSAFAAQGASRTTVVMPVRAGYAELRRFIAHALQADDALALERIRLRRSSAATPELEGELQWALLQRSAAAVTP